MRKKSIYKLLLGLTLIISNNLICINDSLINKLTFDGNKDVVSLEGHGFQIKADEVQLLKWLFFNYDNYHKIDLNDSGYIVLSQPLINVNTTPFNGCGWFKLYFSIKKSDVKQPFMLQFEQVGASEFYIDGKSYGGFGLIYNTQKKDNPKVIKKVNIPILISDTLTHSILIRYSLYNFNNYKTKYGAQVFGLKNVHFTSNLYEKTSSLRVVIQKIFYMLAAFFFALFHIHFFIYFLYREKSIHLYYSGFLLFLALSFFIPFLETLISNPDSYYLFNSINSLFFPTCCLFLITLLYRLFKLKFNWSFYIFSFLYLGTIISVFVRGYDFFPVVLIVYTYFSSIFISIKALRRKLSGSKFLGWGVISVTVNVILGFIFILIAASIKSDYIEMFVNLALILTLIGSILSIPVFMSAYLAYDFATINKSLKIQLLENDALSQKTIQQEKEKQDILSNQNRILEIQVDERTKEIADKNKLLEHQKKEITDSINYAKRIQQALLPDLKDIYTALPNCFILYIPKDIVSGDFYFFHSFNDSVVKSGSENDGVIIAAADCTGHGVPGALMSMIVHEKLVYAMKKHKEPGAILQMINQKVKDALKQHQAEGSSRDGCDIAICKIKNDTIIYSGAYRPLYLFNKEGVFSEIKPTKTAIAGLTPYEQQFDQVEINKNEIKAAYMFSDGYADQFGGVQSKKLTTKKFKELLATIYDLPVAIQKDKLERFFNDWKGDVEQIDDILIIGLTF